MRPFPWPQKKNFTPEVLYIVCSCHEQSNKRYSCPVPRAPKATIRLRSKIQQLFFVAKICYANLRYQEALDWMQLPSFVRSVLIELLWYGGFPVDFPNPKSVARWPRAVRLGSSLSHGGSGQAAIGSVGLGAADQAEARVSRAVAAARGWCTVRDPVV